MSLKEKITNMLKINPETVIDDSNKLKPVPRKKTSTPKNIEKINKGGRPRKVEERKKNPLSLGFKLENMNDVSKAIDKLVTWNLEGKLDNRDLGAINGAIRNLISILTGPQPSEKSERDVSVVREEAVKKFLLNLPLELQDKYVEYLRSKRIRGGAASTAGSTVPSGEAGVPEQLASQANNG